MISNPVWSYVFQAVDITSCGNFAVIALSSGHIDVYNMQSGFHRGHYGKDKGELTYRTSGLKYMQF